jgi:DNA-binding response OmpR family regulator
MGDTKTKLLLVEDDKNLGTLLQEYLNAKGFETKLAVNGKEGFDLFKKNAFDICVLDVMMPVKDGITLAKEIRSNDKNIPIVFLTAKSMKEDTIEGFMAGADDYITKPFSMEELLLRLNAILRRTKTGQDEAAGKEQFEIGSYHFDHSTQKLTNKDGAQSLTTKEADLLKLLCVHINDVLDRNFALNSVWKNDNYFNSRSMDVYISRLRKYFKDDPNIEILNIHGKGFKLIIKK